MTFKMHKNGMDACIEIIKIQYRDAKRIKLKVRWWNLGYVGKPWLLTPKPETLTLSHENWKQWVNITDRMYIPRTKSGLPEETP